MNIDDPKINEVDPLFSIKETAEFLDCSESTVWRRIADGTLPDPLKIGGLRRLQYSELRSVIDKAKAARGQL